MKREDPYNDRSYMGLVNRIRDGIALTDHQKKRMAECGLTVDDFKNVRSTEEATAIINALRLNPDELKQEGVMFEQGSSIRCVNEIQVISKEEFDKMWSRALPCNRRLELTLPVLNVVQGGVYYIQEGHLQTKTGEIGK